MFCNKDYVTAIKGVHIKEDSLNFSLNTLNVSIRDLDQDGFIRLNHTSSEDIFKTSWSRPKYSSWSYVFRRLAKNLQDIFKTSWRRRQDVIKTYLRGLARTSSKRLAKMSSRHLQDVLQRCLQDVFKTYNQVKLFLFTLVPSLQMKPRKHSTGKYVWHHFWKGEKPWWDSKLNECLCRSSRSKGFLK